MKDAVKVSAPQNLDGDVFEDDYEGPKDVSWISDAVALLFSYFILPLPPSFPSPF